MMKDCKAVARIFAVGVLVGLAGLATAQQAYPIKPIRFIVPFPPGGSTTSVARIVGQKLSENWGQQVIVDNRGGGNTIIGTEALTKSAADGYTILLAISTHVLLPSLQPLPYDAIKDFAPVATVASTEFVLVIHPAVPANNLREFIALAKSKPGQLNYASSGSASGTHLAGELFVIMTGAKIQHVPYKGGGPAIADLIGGQVQASFQTPIVSIPHIKSGKLRALAVSGDDRLSAVPQLATFTEAGLAGFDVRNWQGVLAPAGTSRDILNKMANEIGKIIGMAEIKEKLVSQGLEPFFSTPEQFAALMKTDLAGYAKLVKSANIKLDN